VEWHGRAEEAVAGAVTEVGNAWTGPAGPGAGSGAARSGPAGLGAGASGAWSGPAGAGAGFGAARSGPGIAGPVPGDQLDGWEAAALDAAWLATVAGRLRAAVAPLASDPHGAIPSFLGRLQDVTRTPPGQPGL